MWTGIGVGTIINGLFGRDICRQVIIGFVQMFLTVLFIGWLWSVYWGILIWGKRKGNRGNTLL